MKNIRTPMLIVILLWNTFVSAQSKIEGHLVNSKTEPLSFASLILLNVADSSFVKGEISDSNGKFTINNLQSGHYLLMCSSMGYKKSTLSKIEIHPQKDVDLGRLVVEEEATELNEVVVDANRPLFEQQLDRLVMNVGVLPTMSGNTALELLQKTPGLIVSRQDNSISILGKGEVLVMINNKVQRIPGEVLASKLQSMRAENIERIEVIHQPPAKYDASGAAGIVHIVLKENNLDGTNSTIALSGGYGQREKAGFSLNANSRKERINWYGDYSYNLNRANKYVVNHFREYEYDGNNYFHDNYVSLRNFSVAQHAINAGFDADISNRTIFGLLVGGATSKQVWAADADSRSSDYINDQLTGQNTYVFDTKTDMSSLTVNANLFRKTGSGGFISMNADYAKIHYENSGDLKDIDDANHAIGYNRPTPMQFWIFSLDNMNPISTMWTMETGLKATFNNTSSNTSVESGNDNYWANSDLLGRQQIIRERIYAAYLSFKGDVTKKLNSELGIRYEHYNYQLQSANQSDFNKAFRNPFPIFRLNYKIDSVNTIQLGFNRSITRPSFTSLTSFLLMFDPSLIVYASPQLRPTFTNTLKASWQHRSVIWSVAYLHRKNNIYFYNTVNKEDHIQTSRPTNLDKENIIEASLTTPLNPFAWWEMSWSLNVFYHTVSDVSSHPVKFEANIVTYAIQGTSTFLLNKGWSLGVDGLYRSYYLVGDQRQHNWPFVNMGIRKKFPSGSSLNFSLQDIANSSGIKDWGYQQSELGIRTFGHNDFSERQVRITYTLTLGNQMLKGKRQRNTGTDDVKNRM